MLGDRQSWLAFDRLWQQPQGLPVKTGYINPLPHGWGEGVSRFLPKSDYLFLQYLNSLGIWPGLDFEHVS